MVKNFTYFYLSFAQLLQSVHCFPARGRVNAFFHNRVQTRIAGASRQIDQRSRSADTWGNPALL